MPMLNRILLMFFLLWGLLACDPVGEHERLIVLAPSESAALRRVLLEEFTGQNCIHCPRAQERIASLRSRYGRERIVAVAMHAGPLSMVNTASQKGLSNALSEEYYRHWQIPWIPTAHIARRGKLLNESDWESAVAQTLRDSTNIVIELSPVYQAQHRCAQLTLRVRSEKEAVQGRVQVWLVENHVIAPQKMATGEVVPNYVHQHVLRESFNGTWGEKVSVSPTNTATLSYVLPISSDYVPENLEIVAFYYDEKGVQQVSTAALPVF